MNRFVLSNESVFEQNGQRIKILTSGIDLNDRFMDNPVMLFNHNPEKVLGKWTDVQVSEGTLSAIPQFDLDEDSLDIAGKVENNSLKKASVLLDVVDAYFEGDLLVVDKSILLEGSIVAIPANKEAKKLELSKVKFMKSGQPINIKTLAASYAGKATKEVKETVEETTLETTEPSVLVVEDVEVTPEIVTSPSESPITDEQVLVVEQIVDEEPKSDEEAVEPIASETDLLKEQLTTLQLSKSNLEAELAKVSESFENFKKDVAIKEALKDAKITKENVPTYMELSYEKLTKILSTLQPQKQSLSLSLKAGVATAKEVVKDYEWYNKNDRGYLVKLSKENPTLLKQLEEDYINKHKN